MHTKILADMHELEWVRDQLFIYTIREKIGICPF